MIIPVGSFQIEDHVATHHQDLLDQATAVEKLENELSSVSLQSEQLLASVENTVARVNQPFKSVSQQVPTYDYSGGQRKLFPKPLF